MPRFQCVIREKRLLVILVDEIFKSCGNFLLAIATIEGFASDDLSQPRHIEETQLVCICHVFTLSGWAIVSSVRVTGVVISTVDFGWSVFGKWLQLDPRFGRLCASPVFEVQGWIAAQTWLVTGFFFILS